jgi:hypothetical protein
MNDRLRLERWRLRRRLGLSRRPSSWASTLPWSAGGTGGTDSSCSQGVSSAPPPDPRLANVQQRGAASIFTQVGLARYDRRLER